MQARVVTRRNELCTLSMREVMASSGSELWLKQFEMETRKDEGVQLRQRMTPCLSSASRGSHSSTKAELSSRKPKMTISILCVADSMLWRLATTPVLGTLGKHAVLFIGQDVKPPASLCSCFWLGGLSVTRGVSVTGVKTGWWWLGV